MEIRNNTNIKMDDTDTSNLKKTSAEEFPRPLSPCESEISVGCENETGGPAPASPMDMTEEMTEDDEGDNGANSPSTSLSRSLSRDPRSPQTLSPVSVHDESESFTYLSEDEYFRPLKRLAMSDSSPQAPNPSRDHLSESMSSPEPSTLPIQNKHEQQDTKQQQQQQQQQQPTSPRQPSPKLKSHQRIANNEGDTEEGEAEAHEAELRERREELELQAEQKLSGLRSFSILDILSYKPSRRKSSIPVKIVRPWDTREDPSPDTTPTRPSHNQEPTNNNNNNSNNNNNNNNTNNNNNKRQGGQNNDRGSALDALFKMTNKTLDNLNKEDKADAVNLFNNRQPTKKKRKSRTAFTNHQIFELEKRFLYQKYLSPADRDELAQSLGLSNAQVITWFQNRRAKLKRDMEELKRDVESSKVIHNKTLLEASANVVAFLKAKELPKLHLASLQH